MFEYPETINHNVEHISNDAKIAYYMEKALITLNIPTNRALSKQRNQAMFMAVVLNMDEIKNEIFRLLTISNQFVATKYFKQLAELLRMYTELFNTIKHDTVLSL